MIKLTKLQRAVIITAALALLAAGAFVYFRSHWARVTAPGGTHYAEYNHFTSILTIQTVNSQEKLLIKYPAEPEFFWSEDGDLLVVNYGPRPEVIRLSTNTSLYMPTPSDINDALGESKLSQVDFDNSTVRITDLIGGTAASISFSLANADTGDVICGEFSYDYSNYSISGMTILEK